LNATDRVIGLIGRFAVCFIDRRRAELVEHLVSTLVGQRVFGIALGYADHNDHDELPAPIMAVLAGKLEAVRPDCAPVAGTSQLAGAEPGSDGLTRSAKIRRRLKACSSRCSWMRTRGRRGRSFLISMPPTICTGIRRGGSSAATTTAICRCTSSAAVYLRAEFERSRPV